MFLDLKATLAGDSDKVSMRCDFAVGGSRKKGSVPEWINLHCLSDNG